MIRPLSFVLIGALCAGSALADGDDNCPGAAVAALPFNDTGTTIGGNNTIATHATSACTNYTAVQGPDKIYRLVVATAGTMNITVTPQAGYDTSIYLLNDAVFACPAGTGSVAPAAACVGGADDVLSGGAETISLAALPAGTYNLFVDSFYSTGALSAGTFSLAITGSAVLGGGTAADTSITKTNGSTTSVIGGSTTYTITASNAGPGTSTLATVADTFPAACTAVSWTCAGAGGGTCTTASGTGNINHTVTLPTGGTATFTAQCTISGSASGTLVNTATITNAVGTPDPDTANNSATDTDTLVTAGSLVVAPVSINFGTVGIGSTSSVQSVTLSNDGGSSLSVTSLTAAAAPFASAGGTCGATPITIAAGASCTLDYTFSPTAAGAATQVFTPVVAGNPGSTFTLAGEGAAGVLSVSTKALAFGSATVGSGTSRTLTISNTGAGPLTVSSISAPTAPFSVTGGTCGATPFTLAAGASCTVVYLYAPINATTSTQQITVTAGADQSVITFTGTGVVAIPLNTLSSWSSALLLMLFGLTSMVLLRRKG